MSSRQSMIAVPVPVLSLSQHVQHLLDASTKGRVLGRFHRAVDLLIDDQVLALVTPEIGDGPFNVVVPRFPGEALPRKFIVRSDETGYSLGPWRLRFGPGSRVWDPQPPWASLRPRSSALRAVRRVIDEATSNVSCSPLAAAQSKMDSRVTALDEALLAQEPAAIRSAAAALAGWGPGLTPSGDDYLAGLMLGLWSITDAHATRLDTEQALVSSFAFSRETLCGWITQAAAPRTNRISRAFLAAARDGLADAHWHALLRALTDGEPLAVEQAAKTVLAFGATSGFDMLLGFLHTHECLSAVCNVQPATCNSFL